MKKIVSTVAMLGLAFLPSFALASTFKSGDQPSIGATETIIDDLYIVGGNVSVAGNILGDLIAGGGTVLVSGDIQSDLIAGGGTITVLSKIGDDLRLAGGSITIQGGVQDDVLIAGGQVRLGGPSVGGDVSIAAGVVTIETQISGDVRVGGGEVYINSPILGKVIVEGGELTLGPKADLRNDLTYRTEKEAVMEEGSRVQGKITYEPRKYDGAKGAAKAGLFALVSIWIVGKFLALFFSALLLGLYFRRYSSELVRISTENPLRELGRGFIVAVVLPIASVALCATLIGIPLGLIGFVIYGVILIFAWMVTPIILGSVVKRYIFKRGLDVSWKSILLGTVLYSILGIVPFVGWLITCGFFLLALGAGAKIKMDTLGQWR